MVALVAAWGCTRLMHRACGWALWTGPDTQLWGELRELGTQGGFLWQEEDCLQKMSQNLLQVSQGHVTAAVSVMPMGRGGL